MEKKTTAGQRFHRSQWTLDVVRENQQEAGWILVCLSNDDISAARQYLIEMHKSDRDALVQSGGILTDDQIELLK